VCVCVRACVLVVTLYLWPVFNYILKNNTTELLVVMQSASNDLQLKMLVCQTWALVTKPTWRRLVKVNLVNLGLC